MKTTEKAKWNELAYYLFTRSKEICQDNKCTEDEHFCESYAYIDENGNLLDICISDYFPGSSEPVAAIPLPFDDTGEELFKEVQEQCFEIKGY